MRIAANSYFFLAHQKAGIYRPSGRSHIGNGTMAQGKIVPPVSRGVQVERFRVYDDNKIYPALENVNGVRMLVGLQTDRTVYELWQRAQRDGKLALQSHTFTKQQVSQDVLTELEKAPDTAAIETGVHKFAERLRPGKLEIKAYHPSLTTEP